MPQKKTFGAAFRDLWVGGTVGGFFAILTSTAPRFFTNNYLQDHQTTGFVFLKFAYLLWLLAYFFITNIDNSDETDPHVFPEIFFDVAQSTGSLLAAYCIGFVGTKTGYYTDGELNIALRWANGSIGFICLLSLILFFPTLKWHAINFLRLTGLLLAGGGVAATFGPSSDFLFAFSIVVLGLLTLVLGIYVFVPGRGLGRRQVEAAASQSEAVTAPLTPAVAPVAASANPMSAPGWTGFSAFLAMIGVVILVVPFFAARGSSGIGTLRIASVEKQRLRGYDEVIRLTSAKSDTSHGIDVCQIRKNFKTHDVTAAIVVGRTDRRPLSPKATELYGDNAGLAQRRADSVARMLTAPRDSSCGQALEVAIPVIGGSRLNLPAGSHLSGESLRAALDSDRFVEIHGLRLARDPQ